MVIVKLVAGGDEIEHEARSIYRSKGFDSRPIFKENRYHDELDVLDDEFQVSNRLALDNFFSTFVPSALINNSLPIERIDKAVTKLLNSRPRHRVKIRSRQRNTVTGSSKGGLKWGERPSKFILRQCRDYTPP